MEEWRAAIDKTLLKMTELQWVESQHGADLYPRRLA
jgi:hypothetical protein